MIILRRIVRLEHKWKWFRIIRDGSFGMTAGKTQGYVTIIVTYFQSPTDKIQTSEQLHMRFWV